MSESLATGETGVPLRLGERNRAARRGTRFRAIVLDHLAGHKREIALAVLCAAGASAMALAVPWPLKLIFDHILLGKPPPAALAAAAPWLHAGSVYALAVLAASLVAIALVAGVFAYYQLYLTSRIGNQLVYRLRGELIEHLHRLSLSYHAAAKTGELMSQVTSETSMLRDVFAQHALTAAGHVLTVAGMFAIMLAIDWKCGLVVLVVFPLVLAALFFVLRRLKRSARRQRRKEGRLAARVSEMLGAVGMAQAFGTERAQIARFASESAQSMKQSIRTARIQAAAARVVELVTAIGTCVVVLFGGMQVLSGTMTPGGLLVFTSYVAMMYRPVRAMARLSARMSRAGASIERLTRILEAKPEIEDAADAVMPHPLHGDIGFEDVRFGYEPGQAVLKGVSFTIRAGQHVALVGASGAGKTTIAHLILRLHDPAAGRILVDGLDLRHYRREPLRHQIGMVLQDNVLLGASVRENIAYGKPDATPAEIEAAAREAQAHDFIAALPDGYEHVVGEGGCTLSGGQRQRIALARALIKRPPILILDEPTSAMDAEAEAMVRERVRSVHRARTVLVISHRVDTARAADWILVLRDGRIVEQGTHEQLVREGGDYCRLFGIAGAQLASPG